MTIAPLNPAVAPTVTYEYQNSGYYQFPLAANGWGTIHPIPDMAPPLLAKEEGPLT
jgi:hypothetical protein